MLAFVSEKIRTKNYPCCFQFFSLCLGRILTPRNSSELHFFLLQKGKSKNYFKSRSFDLLWLNNKNIFDRRYTVFSWHPFEKHKRKGQKSNGLQRSALPKDSLLKGDISKDKTIEVTAFQHFLQRSSKMGALPLLSTALESEPNMTETAH